MKCYSDERLLPPISVLKFGIVCAIVAAIFGYFGLNGVSKFFFSFGSIVILQIGLYFIGEISVCYPVFVIHQIVAIILFYYMHTYWQQGYFVLEIIVFVWMLYYFLTQYHGDILREQIAKLDSRAREEVSFMRTEYEKYRKKFEHYNDEVREFRDFLYSVKKKTLFCDVAKGLEEIKIPWNPSWKKECPEFCGNIYGLRALMDGKNDVKMYNEKLQEYFYKLRLERRNLYEEMRQVDTRIRVFKTVKKEVEAGKKIEECVINMDGVDEELKKSFSGISVAIVDAYKKDDNALRKDLMKYLKKRIKTRRKKYD